MSTDTDNREQYRARFQAAQDEVADFQATGMLSYEAEHLLSQLPPVSAIADEKVRACVSIGDTYNRSLVAIAHAAGKHAHTRREADAFFGLWDPKCGHGPYKSNIRGLILGSIWKRIEREGGLSQSDLKRALRWLYHRGKDYFERVRQINSIPVELTT